MRSTLQITLLAAAIAGCTSSPTRQLGASSSASSLASSTGGRSSSSASSSSGHSASSGSTGPSSTSGSSGSTTSTSSSTGTTSAGSGSGAASTSGSSATASSSTGTSGSTGGECNINGTIIPAGYTTNCITCDPSQSVSSWSNAPDGTPCGGSNACIRGTCSPGCAIDGGIYFDGQAAPDNSCNWCIASRTSTAWTPRLFRAPVSLQTGTANALALGDFTGDGRLDLVRAVDSPAYSSLLEILPGLPDAGFGAPGPMIDGGAPGQFRPLALADFNRDNRLDLAFAAAFGQISIFTNTGSGLQLTATLPASAAAIFAADIDGDGFPDLLASSSGATYFHNDTDGGFSKRPVAFIWGGADIIAGDFNGDGLLDLATSIGGPLQGGVNNKQTSLSILLNAGDGGFAPYSTLTWFGTGTTQAFGYGLAPIRLAGSPYDSITEVIDDQNNVNAVLFNSPQGNGRILTSALFAGEQVLTGDFNGDGLTDLAFPGFDGITLMLALDGGGFSAPDLYAFKTGNRAAVGDINGDGKTDLAVAGNGFVDGGGNIKLLLTCP